ncbi:nucleoside diphosphate kinase [Cladochytrium replicatum]|nr:nucleoside diphosphate kinase [Cladochytrium replicatum]
MSALERYCFIVHWFDSHAQLNREYQLFFYAQDNSVEMFDIKQRRMFLKRTKHDQLKLEDLYIGAAVNLFSRQLNVIEYGDDFTISKLQNSTERILMLIKPHAYDRFGDIIDHILGERFTICRARILKLDHGTAPSFLGSEASKQAESFEGPHALAIELMSADGVKMLHSVAGPESVEEAKKDKPESLRAKFGEQGYMNAVFVPKSAESSKQICEKLFGAEQRKIRTSRFLNSTLAIIRPHAVNAGLTGKIISAILSNGYQITDLELFHLEGVNAQEFLEVYKGVLPEYHHMLDQLTSGSLIAMEVVSRDSAKSATVVQSFRELCGPIDPLLARQLRPKSLRALFGVDKVRNAIHCTDLPEDGPLEVEYFFKILVS